MLNYSFHSYIVSDSSETDHSSNICWQESWTQAISQVLIKGEMVNR